MVSILYMDRGQADLWRPTRMAPAGADADPEGGDIPILHGEPVIAMTWPGSGIKADHRYSATPCPMGVIRNVAKETVIPPCPPVSRKPLHMRDIRMAGYQRDDGLFDIEGQLVDRKAADFQIRNGPLIPANAAIHDMRIRLTIDLDYVVRAVAAASVAVPFPVCPRAADGLQALVGANVGGGWGRLVRSRLTGVRGCTHLIELLIALGTVAFQTLVPLRRAYPVPCDESGKPRQIDSCLAYAGDGDVVAVTWPRFSTRARTQE